MGRLLTVKIHKAQHVLIQFGRLCGERTQNSNDFSLTLTRVQVHDPGIYVRLRCAKSPRHGQLQADVQDGQGLPVQRPPPHRHNKRDRIDEAALLERQQLVHHIVYLDVGNLCSSKMAM